MHNYTNAYVCFVKRSLLPTDAAVNRHEKRHDNAFTIISAWSDTISSLRIYYIKLCINTEHRVSIWQCGVHSNARNYEDTILAGPRAAWIVWTWHHYRRDAVCRFMKLDDVHFVITQTLWPRARDQILFAKNTLCICRQHKMCVGFCNAMLRQLRILTFSPYLLVLIVFPNSDMPPLAQLHHSAMCVVRNFRGKQ